MLKVNTFVAISMGLLIGFCGNLFGKERNYPLSKIRKARIYKIIGEFYKDGSDLKDPVTKEAILFNVKGFIPLVPKEKADLRTTKDFAKLISKELKKYFPLSAQELEKKIKAKAEKLFKPYKLLDTVTVNYTKGEKSFSVRGIFYSYGGNSIKVGDSIIAIYDLTPNTRAHFDKVYAKKIKREYVEKALNKFYELKTNYSLDLFEKLKQEQINNNEARGYIFYGRAWRTPKEIVELGILDYLNKAPVKRAKDTAIANNKSPKQTEKKETKPLEPSKPVEIKRTQKYAKELTYQEVKARSDAMRKEIVARYTGIDADQGYQSALWGMTREEVNILLAKELTPSLNNSDVETIVKPKGPIEKIELHFYKNLLYKTVISFRIPTPQVMADLTRVLRERYGETDEDKQAKIDAEIARKKAEEARKKAEAKKKKLAEEARKSGKKPTKKKRKSRKKGKKKKKKEPAVEPLKPLHEVFHWTGETTNGTLRINVNAERTACELFSLTKESKKVKAYADKLEQERLEKLEAEKRKKELDEWKSQNIDF